MTVVIDGTTGIDAVQNGTVAQADLAANVAGNGPAFSAYRSGSSQSMTNGVYTKVQFNTEDFDTANCFDSSTNYRFTPNVAGYYLITLGLTTTGTANGAYAAIYKNGSLYVEAGTSVSSTEPFVSVTLYLNGTTDYVEGYAYLAGATPAVVNAAQTRFSGCIVRAA